MGADSARTFSVWRSRWISKPLLWKQKKNNNYEIIVVISQMFLSIAEDLKAKGSTLALWGIGIQTPNLLISSSES